MIVSLPNNKLLLYSFFKLPIKLFIMKKYFLFVLFIFFLFPVNKLISQIKPDFLDLTIQSNATTVLFSSLLSGSIDLDVYNFGKNNFKYYTGFRFEYDRYSYYDVGGGHRGPYNAYAFLGKFSLSGKLLECNYYLGLSHNLTKDWGIIKTSLEIKLKVYKNFVGFVLNPGYIGNGKNGDFIGGLGFFIGASTKDIKF